MLMLILLFCIVNAVFYVIIIIIIRCTVYVNVIQGK